MTGHPGPAAPERGSNLWNRLLTQRVQFALDLAALSATFVFVYVLRFELAPTGGQLRLMLYQLPLVVLVQFAALQLTGVYSFIWRYISLGEVKAFVYAAAASFLPIVALRLALTDRLQEWRVPLSIIVMDTAFAFGGVLGLRVVRRLLYERYEKLKQESGRRGRELTPVLLVGAGQAGVLAAREIVNRASTGLDVKGFLDDDPKKHGAVVAGVRVLGTTADLPRLVPELGIDHVIITIARASRKDIAALVSLCDRVPVKVRIIPGLFEILDGRVAVNRIRDVEIEDLLGREAVELDKAEVGRFLTGKVVMVTGAGGSIGSELARQVARLGPLRLLLVERAEFALFDIDRELRAALPGLPLVPLVADVGDEARMDSIFARYRPQVVFHAAAHKHVPLMEWNPTEAVKNNVLGTSALGEAAGRHGVEVFVFISTDKAVRPTSVMGASKRVAELVVQGLNARFKTRFLAVRFGNVLGSAGSVIPIFREQIRKGGPVTVTHPDMVRYFMTIPEAAQLVLQAGAMGEGGEIFVLDMGEPVRIADLAREMVHLSGLKPGEDIEIVFTGVRPGEKLVEVLDTEGEEIAKTRHPKIFIGKIASRPGAEVQEALARLAALARDGGEGPLRVLLGEILPEAALSGTRMGNPADSEAEGERPDG